MGNRQKPKVRVTGNIYGWLNLYLRILTKSAEFILSKLNAKVEPKGITKPEDLIEAIREVFNTVLSLLPQYNPYTFVAWSLAQNTWGYLKEVSSTLYPNILDNKELLSILGVGEVYDVGLGDNYKILGYPDYFSLIPIKSLGLQSIGGAICKIIESTFGMLTYSLADKLKKWFSVPLERVEGAELEKEYVTWALEALVATGWRMPEYLSKNSFKDLSEYRYEGYLPSTFTVDENYIVRGYSLSLRFSLKEFFDELSPLLFLRILTVHYAKRGEIAILVRPYTYVYSRIIGGT